VRILEESMGILREIERNATKPADMKGIFLGVENEGSNKYMNRWYC